MKFAGTLLLSVVSAVAASALVQGMDGYLYGTIAGSGVNDIPTAFRITPAGSLTTVATFNPRIGTRPTGLIQGSDGNFYGAASFGGLPAQGGYGTIFKMSGTGELKRLFAFNKTDGARLLANIIEGADGDLYGMAFGNGNTNTAGGCLATASAPARNRNRCRPTRPRPARPAGPAAATTRAGTRVHAMYGRRRRHAALRLLRADAQGQ